MSETPLSAWLDLPETEPMARALIAAGSPPREPVCYLRVPGRIELLGKHTDYAGGRSLVAAAEQTIDFLVCRSSTPGVECIDIGRGVSALLGPSDWRSRKQDWRDYFSTVAGRLEADFGPMKSGVRLSMRSSLPSAAGLSSSSAITVAGGMALARCGDLARRQRFEERVSSTEVWADYLACCESGRRVIWSESGDGVGTRGGSQDHMAILGCRANHVRQYRYRPAHLEHEVTWPEKWSLVVGVTGVRAEKNGAAGPLFNRLVKQTEELVALISDTSGQVDSLGALVDCGVENGAALLERLETDSSIRDRAELLMRLRHFVAESAQIVPAATGALQIGDMKLFGSLVDESQALGDELLQNQIEEMRVMVATARSEGALAATAFGAGFGGAVWALIEDREKVAFRSRWRDAYRSRFPERPEDTKHPSGWYCTRPADGARWIAIEQALEERAEEKA